MLLTIDIGNTQTVLGLFDGDHLDHTWRIATYDSRTADELAVLITSLLAQHDGGTDVTGIALCSTVPVALHEMRLMCTRYYQDQTVVVVEPGVRTGVPILTDNPKEVGSDRIVNSLAAATIYGGPAIVVDFGTATTFDAVSAKGEYLGGAIAPGVEISVEALGARGAQLRKVELARPRSVIGRNTVEALQSGILFGFAGQVDGIAHRMAAELSDDPSSVTVIATGGLAPMVIDESDVIDEHDPWLTLRGLKLVFERNTG
jgi:type III pantothenate kinase